jgi:aspartokinase-like uncharacterized kinase
MEAIIKIGGSLAKDSLRLRILGQKLGLLAKEHEIIVVPGGGKFADVVRDFDQRFSLSSDVSHRMAILGMDQFGLLLSDLIVNSRVFQRLEEAKDLAEAEGVPIFLPSRLMFQENFLENTWNVTSDSIAVYFASRVHAEKVILVTDVDGIFTSDPRRDSDTKLIEKITARTLLSFNKETSVDNFLPKLLLKAKINCYVVNGNYPERIEDILSGKRTTCTFVPAETG